MTLNDNQLRQVARALAGESFVLASHAGVGDGAISNIDTAATALTDEIGDRIAITRTRNNNVVNFTFVRTGLEVVDTVDGDVLTNVGLFDQSTNGTLLIQNTLPEILHTINFDLEFDITLTPRRT